MFTYKILKRDHDKTVANYRLVHLQGSQTLVVTVCGMVAFDSLIHLQDSQTAYEFIEQMDSLIHLFTYKTLKLVGWRKGEDRSLIHLFTYKTLKP